VIDNPPQGPPSVVTPAPRAKQSGLYGTGFALILLGVIIAGLTYSDLEDTGSWALQAQTAAMIGGPLFVAGAVFIAASAIADAIRGR
jgi:hypothetical protein